MCKTELKFSFYGLSKCARNIKNTLYIYIYIKTFLRTDFSQFAEMQNLKSDVGSRLGRTWQVRIHPAVVAMTILNDVTGCSRC